VNAGRISCCWPVIIYSALPRRIDSSLNAWTRKPRYGYSAILGLANVRELGHLMERVTLLCPDPLIDLEMLEQLCIPLGQPSAPTPAAPPEARTESADEVALIQQALQQTARQCGTRRPFVRNEPGGVSPSYGALSDCTVEPGGSDGRRLAPGASETAYEASRPSG